MESLGLTVESPGHSDVLDIRSSDINRPGLPLSGFWDYFAWQRPQVIGKTEMSYMHSLDPELLTKRLHTFFGYDIPCVIVCHGMRCLREMVVAAKARGIPIYSTREETTVLVLRIINYLNNCLAPSDTITVCWWTCSGPASSSPGTAVWASETAELVRRGHRLVADDLVSSSGEQQPPGGEAPAASFREIRAWASSTSPPWYGIGAVIDNKSIDMVIHFELWDKMAMTGWGWRTIHKPAGGADPKRDPHPPGGNRRWCWRWRPGTCGCKGIHVAKLLDDRLRQQSPQEGRNDRIGVDLGQGSSRQWMKREHSVKVSAPQGQRHYDEVIADIAGTARDAAREAAATGTGSAAWVGIPGVGCFHRHRAPVHNLYWQDIAPAVRLGNFGQRCTWATTPRWYWRSTWRTSRVRKTACW